MASIFTGSLAQKIQIRKACSFQKWLTEKRPFSSYIYAKEKAFLPDDAVNVLQNDAKKCCNAGTRSAHRHVCHRKGPGRGTEEANVTVEIVNRNKWEELNPFAILKVQFRTLNHARYVRLVRFRHYAECDWLQHLPEQVIRSRKVL